MRRNSFVLAVFLLAASPVAAQAASDAPYDAGLLRLSEVLGSLHFLRNLYGETTNVWRDQMETLVSTEKPEERRRAQLVANFNRGYRSFSSTYATCTPSAIEAIRRYTVEGEKISSEIAGRYGN